MPVLLAPLRYLAALRTGKVVLWCYLIWYASTVLHHWDASAHIWLNSLGVSAFIGVALILSVGGKQAALADRWQTFRLFLMPFCVSSFSSHIKGQGFVLIVPPTTQELLHSLGACVAFVGLVYGVQKLTRHLGPPPGVHGPLARSPQHDTH